MPPLLFLNLNLDRTIQRIDTLNGDTVDVVADNAVVHRLGCATGRFLIKFIFLQCLIGIRRIILALMAKIVVVYAAYALVGIITWILITLESQTSSIIIEE